MLRDILFALCLLVLVIAAPLAYYAYKAADPLPPTPLPLKSSQGLTGTERERFYHLTMGGELLPLTWLRALESKQTGKPFMQNIERLGLLSDPGNADGLPIGFTAAPSRDARFLGNMVGLNCAACHTNEITYKGKTLRIDEAPSLFFGEAFVKDLGESLGTTVKSPVKFFGFLKRLATDKEHADTVASQRPGALRLLLVLPGLQELPKLGGLEKELAKLLTDLHKTELARPVPGLQFDFEGKADPKSLIGEIKQGDLKSLLAKKSGKKSPLKGVNPETAETDLRQTLDHFVETMRLLKARIALTQKVKTEMALKLPMTIGGPGRVDDFGSARNLLFDVKQARPVTAPCSIPPLWGTGQLRWSDWDGNTQSTLGRSVATALAAGAVFDPNTYKSTVLPKNLGEMDRLAEKIAPPPWPTAILGKIDRNKAKRGAKLFQEHCAKCHVPADRPLNVPADQPWPPDLLFSSDEIGTDPARAENFAQPLGGRPYAEAIQDMIEKYAQRAYDDQGITPAEAERLAAGHPNVWRTTRKYVARPLISVWATAPYLHNGSVPTLYDLLLPAAKRPKTFPLGQRQYDPVKVGYATEVKGKAIFVFDTTQPGNRNTGHEYGVHLTETERKDLLEHLKGL